MPVIKSAICVCRGNAAAASTSIHICHTNTTLPVEAEFGQQSLLVTAVSLRPPHHKLIITPTHLTHHTPHPSHVSPPPKPSTATLEIKSHPSIFPIRQQPDTQSSHSLAGASVAPAQLSYSATLLHAHPSTTNHTILEPHSFPQPHQHQVTRLTLHPHNSPSFNSRESHSCRRLAGASCASKKAVRCGHTSCCALRPTITSKWP
jgi:hypothetical protein